MSKKPRPSPFSIRLSDDERADLQRRADGLPLGAYAKALLFPAGAQPRRASGLDRRALASALAALGASRLGSNLNQIAKAAHQGALPVTEELEADLRTACAQVAELRVQLLLALGMKIIEASGPDKPLVEVFSQAAGRPE
jgi:hypothetical protein